MLHAGRRNLRDIAVGIFLLCHPVPVAFHVIAVMALALLAGWPHITWSTFVLVVFAHAAMQLSIAILNDYCDRQLDAASKRQKPIVRGFIRPREALYLAVLLFVIMLMLLLFLNTWALLISLFYYILGLSYNLGLKSTLLSGIVFALAIPLIPLYAFVGMNNLSPIVLWLVPVAALSGVAVNLANALPDFEADAAHQARTLAVVLGLRRSFLLCPLLLFLSMLLILLLILTGETPAHAWIVAPAFGLCCVLLAIMRLYYGPQQPASTRRSYFYLIVLVCFLFIGGWLIGAIA